MNPIVIVALSVPAAVMIDWAYQAQIQMIYGAVTDGSTPTRYVLRAPAKFGLLAVLTGVIDWLAISHPGRALQSLLFVLSVALAVAWAGYAAVVAIRAMKERRT